MLNLTFGASLAGPGFERAGAQALESAKAALRHELSVTVLTAKTDTSEAWLAQLERLEKQGTPDRRAHEAWWRDFWERSWVFVEGGPSVTLPVNAHPWRVGVASDGGSRFRGTIVQPRVIGRALSAEEIAQLAGKERGEEHELRAEELAGGCTVAAWIKPAACETGRILDKCTAGRPDGLTFDANPGLSLRWIVGDSRSRPRQQHPDDAAVHAVAGRWPAASRSSGMAEAVERLLQAPRAEANHGRV